MHLAEGLTKQRIVVGRKRVQGCLYGIAKVPCRHDGYGARMT